MITSVIDDENENYRIRIKYWKCVLSWVMHVVIYVLYVCIYVCILCVFGVWLLEEGIDKF